MTPPLRARRRWRQRWWLQGWSWKRHETLWLRLRRARASNACTWLVIDGTVDGSAAAADGRVAAGMLLRSVGGIAAASLTVRAVQQRLLGATPRAPVVLEIAPHSNSKEGPAWCSPAPE